jgi:peptidoglycan hydrolase-like protein with peptidoglycan-binding domain
MWIRASGEKKTMKKFVLSAAIVAIFTAGMTATAGIVTTNAASACTGIVEKSQQYAATLPQLRFGDHGPHVMGLQLALRAQGYTYLRGSGNYVTLTLAAVKDFQRENGINPSGIVGSRTWQALVGRMNVSLTMNGKHSVPAFGLRPGEKNQEKVAPLADRLMRMHPYRHFEEDGYGPEMQKAVRDFQRRAGIKASGIVGPTTWRAMTTVVTVSGGWGC